MSSTSNNIELRLAQLESAIQASSPNVESRLQQVELTQLRQKTEELANQLSENTPKWDVQSIVKELLLPLVTPIAVTVIGIIATNRVTGAIKQRQLELSELTATRDLVEALAAPDVELPDAKARGVVLATFGRSAIAPLILQLQVDKQVRPIAAKSALRSIAFQYPDEVSDQLVRVLNNKRRIFTWKTHRDVIELIGDIGDSAAVSELQRFEKMLSADNALSLYSARVSQDSPPTAEAVDKLKESLEYALGRFELQ